MKNTLNLAAAAALALGSPGAHAHDDEAHAMPRAFDATRVQATDFGQEGDPRKVTRTLRVGTADAMRFTPAHVRAKRGETLRFVVHNDGQVLHEMVLGTRESIAEHAEMMKKAPGMSHAAANIAHVKPGQRSDIVWQFTRSGEFWFACLQPGHFEAGMVGTVSVK